MTDTMLVKVLELKLNNLPLEFDSWQLKARAERVIEDLNDLLDSKALLQHSTFVHKFRLGVDERRDPFTSMVVGLTVHNQRFLDFQYGSKSVGAIEQLVLEDRQRIVAACRNLPTQSALVAIEFAQRIAQPA